MTTQFSNSVDSNIINSENIVALTFIVCFSSILFYVTKKFVDFYVDTNNSQFRFNLFDNIFSKCEKIYNIVNEMFFKKTNVNVNTNTNTNTNANVNRNLNVCNKNLCNTNVCKTNSNPTMIFSPYPCNFGENKNNSFCQFNETSMFNGGCVDRLNRGIDRLNRNNLETCNILDTFGRKEAQRVNRFQRTNERTEKTHQKRNERTERTERTNERNNLNLEKVDTQGFFQSINESIKEFNRFFELVLLCFNQLNAIIKNFLDFQNNFDMNNFNINNFDMKNLESFLNMDNFKIPINEIKTNSSQEERNPNQTSQNQERNTNQSNQSNQANQANQTNSSQEEKNTSQANQSNQANVFVEIAKHFINDNINNGNINNLVNGIFNVPIKQNEERNEERKKEKPQEKEQFKKRKSSIDENLMVD